MHVLTVGTALLLVACSSDRPAEPPVSANAVTLPPTTQPVNDRAAEAASVSLPPVPDASGRKAGAYLDEVGAPLVALLDRARTISLAPAPDMSKCVIVLDALAAGPTPENLVAIADAAPDIVLADAFTSLVTTTNEYLTRCTAAAEMGDTPAQLTGLIVLLDRRIDELT